MIIELFNPKFKEPELIVEMDESGDIIAVQAYVPAYDQHVTVGEVTAFIKGSGYWLERIEAEYQHQLEARRLNLDNDFGKYEDIA